MSIIFGPLFDSHPHPISAEQISLLDAEGRILNKHMLAEEASNEKAAAPGHVIEKETIPFSRTLRMRRLRNSPDG